MTHHHNVTVDTASDTEWLDDESLVEYVSYDAPPTMAVQCGADDTPDTDNGMYITNAALKVLASKSLSPTPRSSTPMSTTHCLGCSCTPTE